MAKDTVLAYTCGMHLQHEKLVHFMVKKCPVSSSVHYALNHFDSLCSYNMFTLIIVHLSPCSSLMSTE